VVLLVIKFATGNATAPEFKTLYALVQWTPDLSELDCNSCLVDAIHQRIPGCCDNKEGGRVIGPSCNLRLRSTSSLTGQQLHHPHHLRPLAPPVSPPPPLTNTNTTKGNHAIMLITQQIMGS
jgi:hypothetical protein